MGLADKRVVILGGTSGTGLQVGKLAAAEGAHVVLASSSQTKGRSRQGCSARRRGTYDRPTEPEQYQDVFRQDRLPCAWHAPTKPSGAAKLMLNAPRMFEYFRMPIPLAWPMGVSLSRVTPARQAGLSEQQRSPADEWHDVLSQAAA
jgi:hypothetical protein